MTNKPNFYDAKYFDWQKEIGEFAGIANKYKFQRFIGSDDKVVDFGCGGGFLLRQIDCADRLGVEINESARDFAREHGTNVVSAADQVEDGWADVVISNHALEHTRNPFWHITELHKKLKPGGRFVIIVPADDISVPFREDDPDQHLYSWSCGNLGNLFSQAGYRVIEVDYHRRHWPPKAPFVARLVGWRMFRILSYLYGHVRRARGEVQLVAERPNLGD